MRHTRQKASAIVEKWNGTLTQWLSLRGGPDGYYVLKPSRQNSRLGRREPHTIHQMTMLQSADTSIATSHLKKGLEEEEKMNKNSKAKAIGAL